MTTRGRLGQRRAVLSLLAPFGVLFVLLYVAPIGFAIWESLFVEKRSGLGLDEPTREFAGLDNFARVFADSSFLDSVGRVILLGAVQVPIMLGLALLLALVLDSARVRFPGFFRVAFFLPFALPGVIAAILWSFLYTPDVSPIADAARSIGVDVNFLSSSVVMWSIGNIITWIYTGYNMLIIYSALKAIPGELFEAAALDGCRGWRVAWHVKIPLVRDALVLTTVFSIIGTLQLFNEPAVMEKISTSVGSRYTPLMFIRATGLDNHDYQYAAASSVVLALITFALSFGFFRFTRRLS